MTNLNANSPFSMFTRLQQEHGNNFLAEMDANGDGITTKAEFQTFMKDAYGAEVSSSTLNQMWAVMDSNKQGEIEGSNLKNYNAIDQDEASDLYELNAKVAEAIAELGTPEGIGETLLKELKGAIEEAIYTAGIGADTNKIVEKLVKEYQKKQKVQNYLEEIKAEIEHLPNYNMLITSFPNEQGSIDALIQSSIITKHYNDLENGTTLIEDLASAFDQEVIAPKLKLLKAEKALDDFVNGSDFYKKVLQKMGLVDTNKALSDKVIAGIEKQIASSGADNGIVMAHKKADVSVPVSDPDYLVKYLQANASTTQAIEDILNEVKAGIANFVKEDGTIDTNKVLEYVAEKFLSRIDDIFEASALDPEDAYKIYEKQKKDANGNASISAGQRLVIIQQAADNYINSLVAAGYGNIVNQFMNGQTFQQMNTKSTTIDDLLKKINEAIKSAGTNNKNGSGSISGIEDFTIMPGGTKNIALKYSGNGDKEFEVSALKGSISALSKISGTFTYTAPATDEYDTITVNVKVDGVVVATKEVKVTALNKPKDPQVYYNAVSNAIGKGFASAGGTGTSETVCANSLNYITSVLDRAKNALIKEGMSPDAVTKAYNATRGFYAACFERIKGDVDSVKKDIKGSKTMEGFSYQDTNGDTQCGSGWNYAIYAENDHTEEAEKYFKNTATANTGIYYFVPRWGVADKPKEHHRCYVKLEQIANVFNNFLSDVLA